MTASPIDLDDYFASMLRAADRVAIAYRSEDRDTIAAVVQDALDVTVPDGAPDPWMTLVGALAVQVNIEVPWRERFAWTFDVAAATGPPPEPGPSSASYLSQSAALHGATWGVAPSSSTARSAA